MMYETEEQQVEALKKWWQENGKSIIAGVVIGLGAVLGWRGWVGYQDQRGAEASAAFEQLVTSVDSGNKEAAIQQADKISREFDATAYASFAALARARLLFEQGDVAAARHELESVVDRAPDTGLREIAVLRLARLLLAGGDDQAAAETLQANPPSPAFAGDYAALRGDIAARAGDRKAARTAYREALSAAVSDPALVQLKLDNLGPEA